MSNDAESKIITEPRHRSKKCYFVIVVILLLIAGLIGGGYFLYQDQMKAISQRIQDLENSTQQSIQSINNEDAETKKALTNLENQFQNKSELLISEAKYLVKIADENLQYRHNVPLALKIMQSVDALFAESNPSQFASVREALAEDIRALQAIPAVDTAGIYAKLLALNKSVDALPLLNKPGQAVPVTSTENANTATSWWQKGLQKTWDSLRHIVVVRYNQSGKLPLIPPDQQVYLYQNWHAMLLNAMTALLRGEEEIYRLSLAEAEAWGKEYLSLESDASQSFIHELEALQKIKIAPDVPNLSRSLQALTVSEKG